MAKDELDISQVTQAVAEIKSTFESFKEANELRLKELAKGTSDPILEEKMAKINADLAQKQELIDKLYAAGRRKHLVIDGKEVDQSDLDTKALSWANMVAKTRGTRVAAYTHDDVLGYKAAFLEYLRKDDRVMGPTEMKALSVGHDPDGGYVVDPDTSGRIVMKQFDTSPMRQYASVQVISTDALEGLFDLDEASCGWVGETATRAETNTPQLRAWRIPVHEQYAKPRATQKLLDDAYIDMEAWLTGKIAEKFSRTENTAFVTGDGVAQPRGFLTYTAGTTLPGTIQQFATGVSGAFAATPSGGDALLNMVYGTKTAYRNNGVWFMNRVTTGAVRQLKDSNGAYIWQPAIVAGQPATLLSYPVATFDDMADYTGASALGLAFGDMAETYQIVDRLGVRILRDPYSAKPYIEFYATKRCGGDVINFEAMKILRFGA
jgi:HK97 family phage major capsid protein